MDRPFDRTSAAYWQERYDLAMMELAAMTKERDEAYPRIAQAEHRLKMEQAYHEQTTKERDEWKRRCENEEHLRIEMDCAWADVNEQYAIERTRADDEKALAGAEIGRAEHLLNQLGVERKALELACDYIAGSEGYKEPVQMHIDYFRKKAED